MTWAKQQLKRSKEQDQKTANKKINPGWIKVRMNEWDDKDDEVKIASQAATIEDIISKCEGGNIVPLENNTTFVKSRKLTRMKQMNPTRSKLESNWR